MPCPHMTVRQGHALLLPMPAGQECGQLRHECEGDTVQRLHVHRADAAGCRRWGRPLPLHPQGPRVLRQHRWAQESPLAVPSCLV